MFYSKGNSSVWVIVTLLVIAAILLFVFSEGNGDGDTSTTTDETMQSVTSEYDEFTAEEVQNALNTGGSVQCAFFEDGVTGISYVSEGQIRVTADAEGVTTNMIFVDGDIYVWEEGATEGISFSADSFPQHSDGAMLPARPADINEGVASGDISCSPTNVEQDLFTLPETVTFVSYATSSMRF